nr:hypothetical protein [Tanacetum cinerariifolium]
MRLFGCHVTILNTLDPLGKFDGKADEGFLVGYSISSKAFRVFNSRTIIVQETLHINFLEKQPNVAGSRPTWLFDIDSLTQFMNYQPVVVGNQPNPSPDPQNTNAGTTFEVKEPESTVYVSPSSCEKTKKHNHKTKSEAKEKSPVELSTEVRNLSKEFEDFSDNSINGVNAASTPVTTVGQNSTNSTNTFSAADMPALEGITYSDDEEDIAPQTRSMTRMVKEQARVTQINTDDFHTCSFACLLSQEEPKRVHQALKDPSWIEAMQEKLLQFKMQKVWVLVDLPKGKRAIGSKWVFRNKKDERGIVIENKARLMDVKSAFLYGTIEEEVYVSQPSRFEDPDYPDKVFVDDIIFGSTNKDLCKAFEKLMKDKFQMSSIDGKLACTPIDIEKPLLKDPDGEEVDVHTYRSMIVNRIFRYLKGKPHLGLWYPKDSPFNLVAYSDSDYAGASLDRKFTTGGHQVSAVETNDVVRLQALIDRRKVLITDDTVRQALQLDDAKSIDCLPNEEIFAVLARMGYEKPSTNLVRNVDSSSKFYMYPIFLQLMINDQVGDLSSHTTKYTSPTLIQKGFANIRRVCKGFSGVDTSLFEGKLVQQQVHDDVANDVADGVDDVVAGANAKPTPPSPTLVTSPPTQQELIPLSSQVAFTPPPSPHQSPSAQPSSPPPQ